MIDLLAVSQESVGALLFMFKMSLEVRRHLCRVDAKLAADEHDKLSPEPSKSQVIIIAERL